MAITEFFTVALMFLGFITLRIGAPILFMALLSLACRRILDTSTQSSSEDETRTRVPNPAYLAGH